MRRTVLGAVVFTAVVWLGAALPAQGVRPLVEVYKDPSCGCCSKWVDHLKQNGFDAKTNEVADIDAVKVAYRVPEKARSCHTARVDGFVIEGHVPAADVARLLKERPTGVVGLAVPGMPIGSPGMEVGTRVQPYDVLAFDTNGQTRVFASHGR